MDAYWADESTSLHHGDCLDVMRQLPDCSVDAIVCDPPYGLANTTPAQVAETLTAWASGDREYLPTGKGFMGRSWDAFVPPVAVWDEALRVLKPGGHLLAFAGSRTVDLMGLGIRLAGFDIRDSISWLTGSGFPKSLNVSKDARFCQCGPAVPYDHDEPSPEHDMPGVHGADVPAAGGVSGRTGALLLSGLPEQGAPADRALSAARGARQSERVVEGRGDAQAPEGELHGSALRPLPAGVRGDGAVGRLRDGAPASDGEVGRPLPDPLGVREPRQSRALGQPAGEPGSLADERGSQAWRGWPLCAGCSKPRVPAGLGTALKPANEPIVVARKPLVGTVAANVMTWGTGGLNIDATRVGNGGQLKWKKPRDMGYHGGTDSGPVAATESIAGRWPTNVVLDEGSAAELDEQSGNRPGAVSNGSKTAEGMAGTDTFRIHAREQKPGYADQGGASRFFPTFRYQAKAPTRERPSYIKEEASDTWAKAGIRKRCAKCGKQEVNVPGSMCACPEPDFQPDPSMQGKVSHPTCKPLELMRWLVRLVTPPGGVVLEPFAGSGTTVEAARLEGFRCIAIEREAEYLPLILARIERSQPASDLPLVEGDVALFDKPQGRWPTNVLLDRSAAVELDEQSGIRAAGNRPKVRNADENRTAYGDFAGQADLVGQRLDSGGASRFFPVFDAEPLPLFDLDDDDDAA